MVSDRQQNRVMQVVVTLREREPNIYLRSDHPKLIALQERDLPLVLRKLEARNLVKLNQVDVKVYEIGLTKEGFIYFETQSAEIRRFWSRSFWIPMVVSFSASLILWLVKFLITGSWV